MLEMNEDQGYFSLHITVYLRLLHLSNELTLLRL